MGIRRRLIRRVGLGCTVGIGLAGGLSCTLRPDGPKQPNVVLIVIDTLRADHCSTYGYALPTTPTLDRVAEQGTLFENAYAAMPTTAPSMASLFTSLHPLVHGVLRNGFVLGSRYAILAEVLQSRGYHTAAFVSSFVVSRNFGFDRGFDLYDDDFSDAQSSYPRMMSWEGIRVPGGFDRRANETTDRVLDWLQRLEQEPSPEPFFLWVHYFDPHHPYDPPQPWRRKFAGQEEPRDLRWAKALYDAEVAFTDSELGRLIRRLDAVSAPQDTLLVITADHGEGLNDHAFMGHGAILYEEAVRVPLILRWPGRIAASSRIGPAASLIDLFPTLLTLLEIPPGAGLVQGQDLSDVLRTGSAPPADRTVFMQRRLYATDTVKSFLVGGIRFDAPLKIKGPKWALRRGDWKFILAPEAGSQELYNLQLDPGEAENLAARQPSQVAELSALLEEWRAVQSSLAASPGLEADEEQLRRLRAMGYVQ